MIVVTTPAGTIGRQVLDRLIAAGEEVRVIVRDPSRLPAAIASAVDVVEGSHGDPHTVDRAFRGADAVFWLAPPNFRAETLDAAYANFARPAAEAMRTHGVRHVVSISALGRGTPWERRAGLVTASLDMDDLIADTGVGFRALTMPSFMDNMLRQVTSIRDHGVFTWPDRGEARRPTCATRDIASAAADLLLERSWSGTGEQAVLGPEDLSLDEQAEIISDVLGRKTVFRQVSVTEFADQIARFGASPTFVKGYADMMTAKAEGMDNAIERTTENTTPTTFREWCEVVLKPAVSATYA